MEVEDYKKINGEYKIDVKNGKIREYILNTNIVLFEGEYLNGKRNGKGEEYYSNILYETLKFEGEYLNGKRNGEGKEYDSNGNLKFEGE